MSPRSRLGSPSVVCLALALALVGCKGESSTEPRAEAPPSAAVQPITFTGQILAHDGSALPAGQLELRRSNMRTPVLSTALAAGGSFVVELPDPGVYTLRLAGVDHAVYDTVFMATGGALELRARLGLPRLGLRSGR